MSVSMNPRDFVIVSKDASLASNSLTARPVRAAESIVVEKANTGDQPLVYELLQTVLSGLSDVDFQHLLDSPDYRADLRLIIRHERKIVGHVRLQPVDIHFGQDVIPTIDLVEFAILPEFQNAGYAEALLCEATAQAKRMGAALITALHDAPEPFQNQFWTEVSAVHPLVMSPRDLLAGLPTYLERIRVTSEYENASAKTDVLLDTRYGIRPWRFNEREILIKLYRKEFSQNYGARSRSPDYWDWLLERRAFHRILVVVDKDAKDKIVGFGVVRRNHLVEFAVDSAHPIAKFRLLRRFALDALESEFHAVGIGPNIPLHDRLLLHDVLSTKQQPSRLVGHLFAKVVSANKLVRAIKKEMAKRCVAAGIDSGQLSLEEPNESVSLEVNAGKVKIRKGANSPNRIMVQDTARLLLAGFQASESQIQVAGRPTAKLAQALFSNVPFERSAWDDLAGNE